MKEFTVAAITASSLAAAALGLSTAAAATPAGPATVAVTVTVPQPSVTRLPADAVFRPVAPRQIIDR
jgi:hypothetical protein